MTHHKSYKNESQDARRHDQHDAVHPNEKKHPKSGANFKQSDSRHKK